jgi:hypothetical protein
VKKIAPQITFLFSSNNLLAILYGAMVYTSHQTKWYWQEKEENKLGLGAGTEK